MLARVVYEALTGDYGGLQMPLVFSDNMVVSRNRNFEVYGTANAGQRVVATFDNEKVALWCKTMARGVLFSLRPVWEKLYPHRNEPATNAPL